MTNDELTGRVGSGPILPVDWPVAIGTTLNFDSDGDSVVTCKQAFTFIVGSNSLYAKGKFSWGLVKEET